MLVEKQGVFFVGFDVKAHLKQQNALREPRFVPGGLSRERSEDAFVSKAIRQAAVLKLEQVVEPVVAFENGLDEMERVGVFEVAQVRRQDLPDLGGGFRGYVHFQGVEPGEPDLIVRTADNHDDADDHDDCQHLRHHNYQGYLRF